jgi:hypothetical protein
MAAKERTPIPEAIAADVLYRSDHTCCVCRINRKVQIHHLDENPRNHDANNLAVLCLNCHDDTQLRGGFTRKPLALEIIQYRESWHRLVKLKLEPHAIGDDKRIFIAEVMHDLIDICHGWRDSFRYVIAPLEQRVASDAWENAFALVPAQFELQIYERLKPFFAVGLERVREVVDRIHTQCGDAMPWDFRTVLVRTRRGLETEGRHYLEFPKSLPNSPVIDLYFAGYFERTLRMLRQLAQSAEHVQQEQLGEDLSLYEGPEED